MSSTNTNNNNNNCLLDMTTNNNNNNNNNENSNNINNSQVLTNKEVDGIALVNYKNNVELNKDDDHLMNTSDDHTSSNENENNDDGTGQYENGDHGVVEEGNAENDMDDDNEDDDEDVDNDVVVDNDDDDDEDDEEYKEDAAESSSSDVDFSPNTRKSVVTRRKTTRSTKKRMRLNDSHSQHNSNSPNLRRSKRQQVKKTYVNDDEEDEDDEEDFQFEDDVEVDDDEEEAEESADGRGEKEEVKNKKRRTTTRQSKPPKNNEQIELSPEDSKLRDKIAESKILAYKEFMNSNEQSGAVSTSESADDNQKQIKYLMKPKNQSYIHTFWVTKDQLFQVPRMKSLFNSFIKRNPVPWVDDDLCFDEDYIQMERIIAQKQEGDHSMYLVKWKSLGYDEATWERDSDIERLDGCKQLVEQFEVRQQINLTKQSTSAKKRAISSYKPIEVSPVFKDGRTLRKYQLEGLNWLVFCYYSQRNCILGDEMGLGKTIQSLGTLEYLRTTANISGPFLVISPLSTLRNWQREAESWTGMNAIIYTGNSEARETIRKHEFYHKNTKNFKFNILITNYETVISDNTLHKIKWEFTVIDEAHRLKNRASKAHTHIKQIKTKHVLLLTGTPLQNDLEELWSLLTFIDPGKFANLDQFLKEYGELTDKTQVDTLQGILQPYLLRRKKEDVEKDLPSKEETIIEVELTSAQKQYYRAIIEKNRDFLQRGRKSGGLNLINVFMEIRKLCNHPFLITGAEDSLIRESNIDTNNEKDMNEFMIKSSSKLVLADKLLTKLRQEPKNKVLIFSQMLGVLDILEDFLSFRGWDYERLDGSDSGDQKQKAIDRFTETEDCFVFLLSTKAGGVGINLTSANTVIIFDSDFNPQNDLQAQSRCHRIGQTQDVKVFRLITRNTYEKYMMEIASKKLGLEQVVLRNMHDASTDSKSETKKGKKKGTSLGLDDSEIESLLKYGAYHLFMGNNNTPNSDGTSDDKTKKESDEDKQLLELDIDQILEKNARVVKYESEKDNGLLNNFSKATFYIEENDTKIDIYDKDFWEKILPEYVNVETLLSKIHEGDVCKTPEDQTRFMNVVKKLVETADATSSDLWLLLHNIHKNENFLQEHREWAQHHLIILDQPRLRKRRRTYNEGYSSWLEDESGSKKAKQKSKSKKGEGKKHEDATYEVSESSDSEEDDTETVAEEELRRTTKTSSLSNMDKARKKASSVPAKKNQKNKSSDDATPSMTTVGDRVTVPPVQISPEERRQLGFGGYLLETKPETHRPVAPQVHSSHVEQIELECDEYVDTDNVQYYYTYEQPQYHPHPHHPTAAIPRSAASHQPDVPSRLTTVHNYMQREYRTDVRPDHRYVTHPNQGGYYEEEFVEPHQQANYYYAHGQEPYYDQQQYHYPVMEHHDREREYYYHPVQHATHNAPYVSEYATNPPTDRGYHQDHADAAVSPQSHNTTVLHPPTSNDTTTNTRSQ